MLKGSITSAVNIVQCVSDSMSHVLVTGRWCGILLLNAHAPKEDKRVIKKLLFRR